MASSTDPNMMTTGGLAADLVGTYIADALLERSEKQAVFYDVCRKETLPNRMGEVIQFNRVERLALPLAPLQEGTTPTATRIRLSKVTAMLDQWGARVILTDRADITLKHPLLQEAKELLSTQHNELVDREIQAVLIGSTGVTFAGTAVTSRAGLGTASPLTTLVVFNTVASLRRAGAKTFDSRGYKGIVDPETEASIMLADTTFVQAAQFSQVVTLKDFDIGKWGGVWWMRSNYMQTYSLIAGGVALASVSNAGTNLAGFGAISVSVQLTKRDPDTGFETGIGALVTTAITATNVAQVSLNTAFLGAGTYRLYAGTSTTTLTLQVGTVTGDGVNTALLINLGTSATAPLIGNNFVMTSTGAVPPAVPPGSSAIVHTAYIFGANAVGCVNLNGGMEAFFVPRKASDSDPLAQRTTVGWKRMFKACVLNPDFFRRIEVSGLV